MGFVNIQNTNFENGVTNRNAADMFGSMRQLDPTLFHTWMDDFDRFQTADYLVTGAGAGTIALVDGVGGILEFTTAGADDDAENIQLGAVGGAGAGHAFDSSRPVYFRCKYFVDADVDSDVVAGLQSIVADPHVPAEGIVFQKVDGSTDILINSYVGSAVVATATLQTVQAVDFTTLEFYWDGIDRVYYGANGTPQGFLDLSAAGAVTAGPVTPTFGVQAGAVAVLTGALDYLFAASERF
jgi:hypothetical protein